jgi:hypothetical protein
MPDADTTLDTASAAHPQFVPAYRFFELVSTAIFVGELEYRLRLARMLLRLTSLRYRAARVWARLRD